MLHSGKKMSVAFLDYEKCFDNINRSLMFQKLMLQNVSSKMLNAIKSMYTEVKCYIKCNNEISDFINSSKGVKQGDPSSPLLAMMFMNDIVNCINDDIEGIISIDGIKLFILLYADDQVIFSSSASSLQYMLDDIQTYCNLWCLKINTKKSKVMIFERGNSHTYYPFKLYNEEIEIVSEFKYLGVYLFKNASWYRTQKYISDHGHSRLHKLICMFNDTELPMSQRCKLFDSLITPILNYGSEIWGFHEGKDIENVHVKFCRYMLNVRKSTNISALYGELGRFPMYIMRKLNMIKYWIKLLNSGNNSIVRLTYDMLKLDTERNISYNKTNWAYQIKHILETHGLLYLWLDQDYMDINYDFIKQRILDNYKQTWFSNIHNSPRLSLYSRIKNDFCFERYLDVIKEKKYLFALCRLRVSAHSLLIETGRHMNIPRENRICKNCTMNVIENEFHFILVCPRFREIRKKYLKPYFCHWPSNVKLELLFKNQSVKSLSNLSKYIYHASIFRLP